MKTKNLSRAEAAGFFLAHDNFTILTHRRPDGDTLGSAAALCRGLRQLGKTAHILENPETTERYRKCLADIDRRLAQVCDTVVEVSAGQYIVHKGELVP